MMKDILANLYRLQTLESAGTKAEPSRAAALRAKIPEGMLATYDRARARGKKGISLVRHNVCTNCRMQVPVAVTATLMRGGLEVCGNCGLYLCLPDQEEQATPDESGKRAAVTRRKHKTSAPTLQTL